MTFFYWLTTYFFKTLFLLLYRYKVYGAQRVKFGAAIIASNHTSYFDPPVIAAALPRKAAFLARSTLFNYPFFSNLIRALNAYPVKGTGSDLSSFKILKGLLLKGTVVVIFPEGGRNAENRLGTIKTGVGMLALHCNVSIIPTYVHGTWSIWPKGQRFPKLWGKIACIFGSPIDWQPYAAMDKKEGQEAMAKRTGEAINALRTWYESGAHGQPP